MKLVIAKGVRRGDENTCCSMVSLFFFRTNEILPLASKDGIAQ